MMKKLLLTFTALLAPVLFFATAAANVNPLEDVCREAPNSAVCIEERATRGQDSTDNRVVSFLGEVVRIMLFALGAIAVVAVMVGALMYVLSGGDPAKTQKAKTTILYALIGVVIATVAQLIILFVLDRL